MTAKITYEKFTRETNHHTFFFNVSFDVEDTMDLIEILEKIFFETYEDHSYKFVKMEVTA